MPFDITATYAAALGLLTVALAAATVVMRAKTGVSYGDGGNTTLQRAIRAHGNLIEYMPIFLILLAVLEVAGTPTVWLHALGATFLAGRVVSAIYFWLFHAFALRVIALWATLLPIGVAALLCLIP